MKTFLPPACRCFVATTLVPESKQKEGFFPTQPISGLPCLQSFHMINRLINLQGKMRKGKRKKGGMGERINGQIEMSFPSLQLDAAASPVSLPPSIFFFLTLLVFFLFGYKSQDVIGTGTEIKQHDLASFLPVPPCHPCWLREIKEGGRGSERGQQRRESPDNSAACVPVFEGLLFYASLIYFIFVQGSQSALGTWGGTAEHTSSFFLGADMQNCSGN